MSCLKIDDLHVDVDGKQILKGVIWKYMSMKHMR